MGGGEIIHHLSLHCHHQNNNKKNDSCIRMGSDKSHFKVALIVKDKVTRQCPQPTTFLKRKLGEPKRNRAEALLLTSLTHHLWAKPAQEGIEPTSSAWAYQPNALVTTRPNCTPDQSLQEATFHSQQAQGVGEVRGVCVWGGGGGAVVTGFQRPVNYTGFTSEGW